MRRINQAVVILKGAAGSLVGIGSAWPWARALARRYISLLVAPFASIAAATTAQLRISVVIVQCIIFTNLAITPRHCEGVNRQETEQQNNAKFANHYINRTSQNHSTGRDALISTAWIEIRTWLPREQPMNWYQARQSTMNHLLQMGRIKCRPN